MGTGDIGRSFKFTDSGSDQKVFLASIQSPGSSLRQCSCQTDVYKTSARHILHNTKWKPYLLRLLYGRNQDPDYKL